MSHSSSSHTPPSEVSSNSEHLLDPLIETIQDNIEETRTDVRQESQGVLKHTRKGVQAIKKGWQKSTHAIKKTWNDRAPVLKQQAERTLRRHPKRTALAAAAIGAGLAWWFRSRHRR